MWLLKLLPDWIFYAVLMGGVCGLLVSKFIPSYYKSAIQTASIVFVIVGLFMCGAIYNNDEWIARVKEMEAKVAQAEVESLKENTKIVEKIVNKTKIVKERGQDIIRYVDKEVVKYDSQCIVPKEFIKALNDASERVQ